jgi:hypothetical protein
MILIPPLLVYRFSFLHDHIPFETFPFPVTSLPISFFVPLYYRQISVVSFLPQIGFFFIHYTLRNCEVLLFSFLYHIILQICHKELSTEQ